MMLKKQDEVMQPCLYPVLMTEHQVNSSQTLIQVLPALYRTLYEACYCDYILWNAKG